MVKVRAATIEDIPRLIEIASQSATAAQWQQNAYSGLFAPEKLQTHRALVVEEAGILVGFLVGRQITSDWEIENIVVSNPQQRRGLGSCLLKEFLHHVRSSAGNAIFLEVRESNLAARALYRKWGFAETGRRKQYYTGPSEDALVLKFNFP